jgi:hypothetical protein
MDMDNKKIWCPKCGTHFEIDWIIETAEKLKELRHFSQLTGHGRLIKNED